MSRETSEACPTASGAVLSPGYSEMSGKIQSLPGRGSQADKERMCVCNSL